jgi:hypothetical protein
MKKATFHSGNDGKFNFQFSPAYNYTYSLIFDKKTYKSLSKSIDRDKE